MRKEEGKGEDASIPDRRQSNPDNPETVNTTNRTAKQRQRTKTLNNRKPYHSLTSPASEEQRPFIECFLRRLPTKVTQSLERQNKLQRPSFPQRECRARTHIVALQDLDAGHPVSGLHAEGKLRIETHRSGRSLSWCYWIGRQEDLGRKTLDADGKENLGQRVGAGFDEALARAQSEISRPIDRPFQK